MKRINSNCWAPHEYDVPVPITDPSVANINNLYYSFYSYNSRGLAVFYYRLSGAMFLYICRSYIGRSSSVT